MSTVHTKTTIAAPPQAVWDTVMDPQRFSDWVTIHKELKQASSGPPREGSTMQQVLQIRGVRFTVKWELTRCEAPRVAEWTGQGPAGSGAVTRYELSEDDAGNTCFEYTNEFTTPGGMLGKAAGRVLVEGVSEREAKSSLARLKTLVEK